MEILQTTEAAKPRLNHVKKIQMFIEMINHSDMSHVLVIEGPPGWGKTTAVQYSLHKAGIEEVHLGSYSTPLQLFLFMQQNRDKNLLLDDCAGIFNEASAMSLLKAATWPSKDGERIVRWRSRIINVDEPEFIFTGKLIIVCNTFPATPDGAAILSRGYDMRVSISVEQAKNLILNAAIDSNWFKNTKAALTVAQFLIKRLSENTLAKISFRTLIKGYELSLFYKDDWQELLLEIMPSELSDPVELVRDLSLRKISVKEQERIFREQTGMQRTSFFKIKRQIKSEVESKSKK